MGSVRIATGSGLLVLLLAGDCANAQQENQSAPSNTAAAGPPARNAASATRDNQTDSAETNASEPADNTARADGRPWPDDVLWFREAVRFCRVWQYQQVVRSDAQIAQIRSDCARLRDTYAALTRQYAGDAEVSALLRDIGGPDSY